MMPDLAGLLSKLPRTGSRCGRACDGIQAQHLLTPTADEHSRSTVKNSLAILVRVLERAVRDGIADRDVARVSGWQREYQQAEDEPEDARSLALPDWKSLTALTAALVARSAGQLKVSGEVGVEL